MQNPQAQANRSHSPESLWRCFHECARAEDLRVLSDRKGAFYMFVSDWSVYERDRVTLVDAGVDPEVIVVFKSVGPRRAASSCPDQGSAWFRANEPSIRRLQHQVSPWLPRGPRGVRGARDGSYGAGGPAGAS